MTQETFTLKNKTKLKHITVTMSIKQWDRIMAAHELVTDKFENFDMNGYDGDYFYFDKDDIAKINEAFL